jgi:hypothetical protein
MLGDRPVECGGFGFGDGFKPFQHLKVATAGQTTVRDQCRDLAGVRGLPVQGCGIRAGWVERADPRGRRAVGRAQCDRPVAGAARAPPVPEERLFYVSMVGLSGQKAEHLRVQAYFLRRHGAERRR